MRITAKEDYAVRACLELARADGGPLTREAIAQAQGIPTAFLQNILVELRRAEIVEAHLGRDGGFRLARPPAEISVADETLREVWIALRAGIRGVLEHVTLKHLATGRLPASVQKLVEQEGSWE